jgi:hypothetical protein
MAVSRNPAVLACRVEVRRTKIGHREPLTE